MKLVLSSANGYSLTKYINDLTPHFKIEEIKDNTFYTPYFSIGRYFIELNTIQDLAKVIEITKYDAIVGDFNNDGLLYLIIYDDYVE